MRRTLRDAQKCAHAKLFHFLFVKHVDLDTEFFKRADFFHEAFGIQHIGRLRHQIAGEEHAFDDLFGTVELFFGVLVIARGNRDGFQNRFIFLGFGGAVFIETIIAQHRTGGEITGHAFHVKQDGHVLLAGRKGAHGDIAAKFLGGDHVKFGFLANPEHDDARKIGIGRRQKLQALPCFPLEGRSLDRLGKCAAGCFVQRHGTWHQIAAIGGKGDHSARGRDGEIGERDLHEKKAPVMFRAYVVSAPAIPPMLECFP